MKISALLCLLVVIASVSSAGCIDIEWTRDALVPVDPIVIEYYNQYSNISYVFNTDPQNLNTLVYQVSEDINVVTGSQRLEVRVNVQLDQLPPGFPSNLSDLIDRLGIDRLVKVTLYTPDGKVWFSETYNITTYQQVQWKPISSPGQGTWKLEVYAEGLGHSAIGYHDNFQIYAFVRRPVE